MISDDNNTVNDNLRQYGKPLSFEDVWRMFQETDKMFQETDKKFQETDRQIKETDKKFQETDRQFKETDKKIKKAWDLFTSQWGRLIESLVEGDLLRILNERKITVNTISQRVEHKSKGKQYEFDIIAENGDQAVFVEVKTTLHPDDVKHFIEKLKQVKTLMSRYRDATVFGAVAYLSSAAGSEAMAQNKGLFAIRATGKSAHITNPEDFAPKTF